MRLIDADALIKDRDENGTDWHMGQSESFRRLINRQPTILCYSTATMGVNLECGGKLISYYCSNCKGYVFGHDKYCSNCGDKFVEG